MSEQKTEQKPEHEKRIREALEAGPTEGPFRVIQAESAAYSYDVMTEDGYYVATAHGLVRGEDNAGEVTAIRALLADLDEARAALTAAKAGGWLPIETAPKDGTRILVWRKHATRPLIARYQKDFEWFEDEDGVHLYHLIYWQPLPNPPKEQSAGGLGSVDAVANPLSPT